MHISGEMIYSVAAVFSLSAYFLGKMLWLRLLLVFASIFYIISGLNLGMTSMVAWNSAYVVINLYHVFVIFIDKSSINLPQLLKGIYDGPFAELSTREFKKLISVNDVLTAQSTFLLKEGERTNKLFVLLEGKMQVLKEGSVLAVLKPGDLIGEMSFISKEPASADVLAEEGAIYTYWTHRDLDRLKRKHNLIYTKFISIIGSDLVKKINNRNKEMLSTVL